METASSILSKIELKLDIETLKNLSEKNKFVYISLVFVLKLAKILSIYYLLTQATSLIQI